MAKKKVTKKLARPRRKSTTISAPASSPEVRTSQSRSADLSQQPEETEVDVDAVRRTEPSRTLDVSTDKVWEQLKQIYQNVLSDSEEAWQDFSEFLDTIELETEQLLEIALRLHDQTHWDTLEIEGGRILMQGVLQMDNISSQARVELRSAFVAVVRLLAGLAVAA